MGAVEANHSSSMIKALVVLSVAALAMSTAMVDSMEVMATATTMARGPLTPRLPPLQIPTMARGLLMLHPLPRLTLTTVSTASVPIMATLATPMSLVLLSTARGLLKLPPKPSPLLIPITDTMGLATSDMLAIPVPMAAITTESKKNCAKVPKNGDDQKHSTCKTLPSNL